MQEAPAARTSGPAETIHHADKRRRPPPLVQIGLQQPPPRLWEAEAEAGACQESHRRRFTRVESTTGQPFSQRSLGAPHLLQRACSSESRQSPASRSSNGQTHLSDERLLGRASPDELGVHEGRGEGERLDKSSGVDVGAARPAKRGAAGREGAHALSQRGDVIAEANAAMEDSRLCSREDRSAASIQWSGPPARLRLHCDLICLPTQL